MRELLEIASRAAGAAAAAAALAACCLAAPAAAAVPPSAYTGAASSVTYDSATLGGDVDPQGSETSYYFQYGPTRAYGSQSAIADAGAGTKGVAVSLPIGGLDPITVYHYRLVAVSSAGASFGGDRTLTTSAVPLSLAIVATPDPVAYGGTITVQGTLSGTGAAGRPVVLQENPFGSAAGFQDVGNPELTNASGGFSFVIADLLQTTGFRVVTTTDPPVASPVVGEAVSVLVASHVARISAHRARFYGTVTPAANGMQVGILRIVHGRGVPVGGGLLRPAGADSSRFSVVLPVRAGVYRVLARDTGGAQISSYGPPLLIG